MYEIDLKAKTLNKVDSTGLKEQKLLERKDLQQFIFNSWESFKNDIGIPGAILLGQEIKPHESVMDSIDLLAFDQNNSSLIVIELKRDKNKLQLLQALSYAAMVATWDSDRLLSLLAKKKEITEEALDFVRSYQVNKAVRVVLVAESYEPEVVITCDWLVTEFGMEISIFSVSLHKVDQRLLLEVDQKYPLPELSETYEARRRSVLETDAQTSVTWEEVLPKLKYPFARDGVEKCRKIRGEGDPRRRRFGDIVRNFEGFNSIAFNFREKYLNVYTSCSDKADCSKKIRALFGNTIEITEWRDGVNFNISQQGDYDTLIRWMKI